MICSAVVCLFVSRSFLPLREEEGVQGFWGWGVLGGGVGGLLPVKFEASTSRVVNLPREFDSAA